MGHCYSHVYLALSDGASTRYLREEESCYPADWKCSFFPMSRAKSASACVPFLSAAAAAENCFEEKDSRHGVSARPFPLSVRCVAGGSLEASDLLRCATMPKLPLQCEERGRWHSGVKNSHDTTTRQG